MTTERWARHPDVAWTGDEDRFAVVNVGPSSTYEPQILEGTAAWLWAELETPKSVDELVDIVVAAIAAPREAVYADLTATIAEWQTRCLIASNP